MFKARRLFFLRLTPCVCFGQHSPSGAGSSPGVKAGVSPLPPAIFCGNFSVRQRNHSLTLSFIYVKSVVFSRDGGSVSARWSWLSPGRAAGAGTAVPSLHVLGTAGYPQQAAIGSCSRAACPLSPATRSLLRLLGCHPAGICSAKGQPRWSEGPSCPWHWELRVLQDPFAIKESGWRTVLTP